MKHLVPYPRGQMTQEMFLDCDYAELERQTYAAVFRARAWAWFKGLKLEVWP